MRRLTPAVALVALLAFAPATALAGGWANVKLSGLPPQAPTAGQTWTVDLDIKQHGVTPLEGVEPAVLLQAPDGTEKRFAAAPTARPGVYRATVRWPAGRWTMHVDDGFSNAFPHTYPTVDVRGAVAPLPAAVEAGGTPVGVWALAAVTVAALLLGPALMIRRRRGLAM